MSDATYKARHWVGNEETDSLVREVVANRLPGADITAMILCFSVIRVADRMQQDFEVYAQRPEGMTWAGFRTMFALATLGPLRPVHLAKLNSVSQASISSVIKTLTRLGLIASSPSSDDGRSITLSLTEKGLTRFNELFRLNNARESLWADVLNEQEQSTLIDLLIKLRESHIEAVEPS